MSPIFEIVDDARIAARALGDRLAGMRHPTLRLGVTGLSRSGKTVFITALVHALSRGARLPVFRAAAEGRIRRAFLTPQPDDAVPRFAYEDHLAALAGPDRRWPESTRRIAELRLVIEYESRGGWFAGPRTLTLDIVDYPGEWLLDLALLGKDFARWSRDTVAASRGPARRDVASEFVAALAGVDPAGPADEETARRVSELFKASLAAARREPFSFSALPPGRFLMPGDLEGSPALTFAPLDLPEGFVARSGSLAAMMERRYEAYRDHVVRPFFRDHFARLDRQVVLVDALAALNAGPAAVEDLQTALQEVLEAFRTGRNSLLSHLFSPRIDRVLFAATKADHLHHTSHDRLEAVLGLLVERARSRAAGLGAAVDLAAVASVRATREARVAHGRERLPAIVGTPLAGEVIGDQRFDGETEAAVFPGELPADPEQALAQAGETEMGLRFVRFRPPVAAPASDGKPGPLPQIRLDRTLEFLLGDRLA
ncbi:YcjX family protein [Alsobacter sp. SYSU M60028]|uniref:YcjX family protein n=1 Tax=Alsobacter ponti TaxID=2962936 RepID=A0ABT1L8G1_9HYPH|nr:YcjX family protein [Alsobacter ponti]MCP8937303.1 YcjX family protein [Alsobacter ponti]